jgi:predicted amino acid dehydrogenase
MVLPDAVRFGARNVLGFPSGINLACLSECIALTMAGATRHYSLGNRISVAEADEVYSLACQHGFEVSIGAIDVEPEPALLDLDAERIQGATEVSG